MSVERVNLSAGEITAALVEYAWRKLGKEGDGPPTGTDYETFVVCEEDKGEMVLKQARVELHL